MGIKIISIDGIPYVNDQQNQQQNNNQQQQHQQTDQQQNRENTQNVYQNVQIQNNAAFQPIQQVQQVNKKLIDKQNFLVSIQYNVQLKQIVLVFTLIFGQPTDFELGVKIQNFLKSKLINFKVRNELHTYNFNGQRCYVVEVDNKLLISTQALQQLQNDATSKVKQITYVHPPLPYNQIKYVKQLCQWRPSQTSQVNCMQYCGQLPKYLNVYQLKLIKELIQKSFQTNLLFLPPGFGKSLIALYVALYFKRPIIIIAPQMLHLHWANQVNKFVNQIKDDFNVYHYKKLTDGIFSQINYKQHRLVLNFKEYKYAYDNYQQFKSKQFKNYILIITLTDLLKLQEANELNLEEVYLIIDESHEYREISTKKTQNAMAVCKVVPFKLLLTATPVVNQIQDIYMLLWLNNFPLSVKEFTNRYARMDNSGKYKKFIGLHHELELRWIFQYYIVQLSKREVQKITLGTEWTQQVANSLPKLPLVKRYVCSFSNQLDKNIIFEDPQAHCLLQYKQASERKQDISFNILRKFAEKKIPFIVYFVNLTNAEYFKDFPDSRCITGQVQGQDRAQIVKDFQDGKFQSLFATIDSLSTGLDVTRAKVIFWLQMEWTMALFEQAEGRIRRINSTYSTVYSIVLTDQNYWDNRVRNIISFKKTLGDWMCHSDALDGIDNYINEVQINQGFRFEQLTSLDQIV